MNRETRRDLMRKGVSQGTIENLDVLDKPCTIKETVSLSKGVAEDVFIQGIEEFRSFINPTLVSLTLWVETLKGKLIEAGIASEEDLQILYEASAENFKKKSQEFIDSMKKEEKVVENSPKVTMMPHALDMQVTRKED